MKMIEETVNKGTGMKIPRRTLGIGTTVCLKR